MDAFWSGLLTVGLAELGDKTQLLVFMLVRQLRRPLVIVSALILAFLLSFAIAGALGVWLQHSGWMSWLRGISALMFIAIGGWMLFSHEEQEPTLKSQPISVLSAFMLAFITILIAELGDKSQLTVVALAITLEPVGWIVLGALIGTLLVNLPVIWLGRRTHSDPLVNTRWQRRIRWLAGTLFIALGAFMLWAQLVSGTSNA